MANQLPSAVRIEMVPLEQKAADLQVMTATIPVRVTASPVLVYSD
jgi:hypothetical protein